MTSPTSPLDPLVAELLEAARAAVERGQPVRAQFLIPSAGGLWRVSCEDLVAAGENDLGIPPRAFAYGAVGMLAAALGAQRCVATEPGMAAPPPGPALATGPSAAGPRRGVVVTVFARGLLEVTVLPYAVADDGAFTWGEPSTRSTADPGPLGSTIPLWRAVNREPAPLPPPAQLLDDMADSGFVITGPGA
jgi:hypothetical protein